MLVLTRKPGESIQLGSNINVVITSIGRGRVQIGIEAPREVSIRRSELQPVNDASARLHSVTVVGTAVPAENVFEKGV